MMGPELLYYNMLELAANLSILSHAYNSTNMSYSDYARMKGETLAESGLPYYWKSQVIKQNIQIPPGIFHLFSMKYQVQYALRSPAFVFKNYEMSYTAKRCIIALADDDIAKWLDILTAPQFKWYLFCRRMKQ